MSTLRHVRTFKDILLWCERGDSNPQATWHMILSHASLPIPPLSRNANVEEFIPFSGESQRKKFVHRNVFIFPRISRSSSSTLLLIGMSR